MCINKDCETITSTGVINGIVELHPNIFMMLNPSIWYKMLLRILLNIQSLCTAYCCAVMIANTMLQGDFFVSTVPLLTSGMHYLKQTEVIWCLLSSKRGLWPVSPIECNLSGALCDLISFCCPALFLSVCVPLAYVFPPCNSNQNSLILHMYERIAESGKTAGFYLRLVMVILSAFKDKPHSHWPRPSSTRLELSM